MHTYYKQPRFSLALASCILLLLSARTVSAAATSTPPTPPATPVVPAPVALDWGDGTSVTLTTKAWNALEKKDYPSVLAYTSKCIDTFKGQALSMQALLKAPLPKDSASQDWALNDVGTCYFIRGQALDQQGDKKGAIEAYKFLVTNLNFAQCWDPKGWFWTPAAAARKRLAELQFDAQ